MGGCGSKTIVDYVQVHRGADDGIEIFGGTVDSVALSFKNAGHESWFFWYATACIEFSLLFYLAIPDTKHNSRMHRHA